MSHRFMHHLHLAFIVADFILMKTHYNRQKNAHKSNMETMKSFNKVTNKCRPKESCVSFSWTKKI